MYKHLVFQGGGVLGLSYAGAIQELSRLGLLDEVTDVAGSSAGAITAFMLSIGYDSEKLLQKTENLPLQTFSDSTWGFARDIFRLFTKYGWHRGRVFEQWVISQLNEQGLSKHLTLKQLDAYNIGPQLHVVATSVKTNQSVVLNAQNTPDMCVVDAIRASMAYPIFYVPVVCDDDILVDGGMLNNLPWFVFSDREKFPENTLLFQILSKKQADLNFLVPGKPSNFFIYAANLVFMLYEELQQRNVSQLGQHGTDNLINIDVGFLQALNFNLTPADKANLIEYGVTAVSEWVKHTQTVSAIR